MNQKLWDLSEAGPDERRVLSQLEREYLMYDDSGSYTRAEMDRRITEKTEKIPGRIQQFIDDISLLHYRGYVRTDSNQGVWDELLSIKNRSRKVRDSPIISGDIPDGETALGFEVGTILRMLQYESNLSDLVWGVILGLVGQPSEQWETEGVELIDLKDDLEENFQRRLITIGVEAQMGDGFEEERKVIREVLREYSISAAPPVVDEIVIGLTSDGGAEIWNITDKYSEATVSGVDFPPEPEEMPASEELLENYISMIVETLDDRTRLRDIDLLVKDLQIDCFRIREKNWRGVYAEPIIMQVGKNGSTQIQDFDQISKGKRNMSAALNILSQEHSSFVNRPVITISQEGTGNWEFTPYGQLLYESVTNHNRSSNWIYDFIFNPDDLEKSVHKVITEHLDNK